MAGDNADFISFVVFDITFASFLKAFRKSYKLSDNSYDYMAFLNDASYKPSSKRALRKFIEHKYTNNCKFEVYDDEKLSHMLYAPDYGQVGETQLAWNEKNSKEYKNQCLSALYDKFKLIELLHCFKLN